VGADVVERQDVRLIERSDRARLLVEAAQALGVGAVGGRQHLDRDVAADA
jgi:hypothetical protein